MNIEKFFKKVQSFIINVGQRLIVLSLTLGIIVFILFELIFLEPINLSNTFVITVIIVLLWLLVMAIPINKDNLNKYDEKKSKQNFKVKVTFTLLSLLIILFFMNLFTSKLFISKKYANLIGEIKDVEFIDIYNDENKIESSYIDKNAALIAAEKKIGELADLSSIYKVDEDNFTKVKYQGKLVRIAPLKHANSNYQLRENSKGIPYYVMVDVSNNKTSAKAELIEVKDNPIKYSPNALFFKSVKRVAFLHNPTYTYGNPTFEINEDGEPYFSIPIIGHKFLGVKGEYLNKVLLVNASTGESVEYKNNEVPEWVDRVYPTKLMLNQAADHYLLKNGFWGTQDMLWSNKVGLKSIDTKIDTYNYITINDEIHVFTGVRPLNKQSNSTTSMLYMNIKTGEVKELNQAGVSINAAKAAAIESVKEKGYTPTTPTLLSVDKKPTYVMTLKSDSGTTYGFSMINYNDLNLNAFGNSLSEVRKNYLSVMSGNGDYESDLDLDDTYIVSDIKMVTVDGNSQFYIKFEGLNSIYVADVTVSENLPFIESGSRVKITSQGNMINYLEVIKDIE